MVLSYVEGRRWEVKMECITEILQRNFSDHHLTPAAAHVEQAAPQGSQI